MFKFELIVVLIRLRTEANLLDLYFDLFLFQLLLALLLLLEEFGIVDETTNRWLGIRGNLNEVYPLLTSHV